MKFEIISKTPLKLGRQSSDHWLYVLKQDAQYFQFLVHFSDEEIFINYQHAFLISSTRLTPVILGDFSNHIMVSLEESIRKDREVTS